MRKPFLTFSTFFCALQMVAQFEPISLIRPISESVFNVCTNYEDINNDGIQEFVNIYGYKLHVLNVMPDGTSETHYFPHNLQNSQHQVRVLDMDSDGDKDVCNGIGWIENLNDTSFAEASHPYSVGQYDSNYITQDLNGDGSYDLLTYGGLYFNNGHGQFSTPYNFVIEEPAILNISYPSVADADNDGDYDLCFINGNTSIVWANNGAGEFAVLTTLSGYQRMGDLNGDGFADFLSQTNTNVYIKLNDQQGGFTEQTIVVPSGVDFLGYLMWYRNQSPFYDIDHDGDMDLIADQAGSAVHVLRNESNTTFAYTGVVATGNRYAGPGAFLFEDVNNDGLYDITMCFQDVYVLTQSLDGSFRSWFVNAEAIHDQNASFSALDIDDDGDEDALSFVPGGMVIYENINQNHLADALYLAPHPAESLVDAYDFSGDGRLDLITYATTANYYRSLSYFEQLPDGGFGPGMELLAPTYASEPLLFDVDQDGVKDIVYYCLPEYPTITTHLVLRWHRFTAAEGFSAPLELGSWTLPLLNFVNRKNLVSGDFNGDGFEDLMSNGRNGVLVFEGDGAGNYTTVQVAGYANASFIIPGDAVDFNGDMIQDIPFCTSSSNVGYVWFNGIGYEIYQMLVTQAISMTTCLHGDIDADGDEDLMYTNYESVSLLFNDGNGFFSISQTTLGLIDQTIYSISLAKINEDELPDLLVTIVSGNPNYPFALYSSVNNSTTSYHLNCHVFVDEDGDGVRDPEEAGLAQRPIGLDAVNGNTYYTYSGGDGQAVIYTSAGVHEVRLYQSTSSLWVPSTPWQYTIELDESNPIMDIYFGVQPIGEVNQLTADITSTQSRCGSPGQHFLTVVNEGNTPLSGILQYTLNEEYEYMGSSPLPTTIEGNVYTWYFDLNVGDSYNVFVGVIMPDWTFMNQYLTSSLEVTSYDAVGNVVASNVAVISERIRCSMDPNDKTVDRGFTESGYVFNNQELEYVIRFENKGNISAENIWVEDDLSDKLDWSTFQLIGHSHPVEIHLSESGRVTFAFENINLPDSISDPEHCSGFLRYRIRMKDDLIAGDEITNTANIIFDYNPAIVTNTTLNTIYECSDLDQSGLLLSELCPGENINAYNLANWIDEITWYYNDVLIDSVANLEFPVATSGVLRMEVRNSLCNTQQSWDVTVNNTNPGFTQSTNLLTANEAVSYQWYQNNEPILGAVSQTYEISESGNYHVETLSEFGCLETSEDLFVAFTGIEEKNSSRIHFGPNPANQYVNVKATDMAIETAEIVDMLGRVVYNQRVNTSGTVQLDVSGLAIGIYSIRLNGENIGQLEIVR